MGGRAESGGSGQSAQRSRRLQPRAHRNLDRVFVIASVCQKSQLGERRLGRFFSPFNKL